MWILIVSTRISQERSCLCPVDIPVGFCSQFWRASIMRSPYPSQSDPKKSFHCVDFRAPVEPETFATLPETNIFAPEEMPFWRETHFQAQPYSGAFAVTLRECNCDPKDVGCFEKGNHIIFALLIPQTFTWFEFHHGNNHLVDWFVERIVFPVFFVGICSGLFYACWYYSAISWWTEVICSWLRVKTRPER